MKMLEELRREANERGNVFLQNVQNLSANLQPHRLLDQTVKSADPGFTALQRLQKRTEENPIALLAVVSSALLLAHQWTASKSGGPARNARRKRVPSSSPTTEKGESHGQHPNTDGL
jgi:hypothetical protein